MGKVIRLSELKDIAIMFPGDLFELAAFLLRANDASVASVPGTVTTRRHSLHGLCACYVGLYSQLSLERIESDLRKLHFDLSALIEWDEEAAATEKPETGNGARLGAIRRIR